jgi:hypothetical protein
MRRTGRYVKSLAPMHGFWHRFVMSEDSDTKAKARSDRLREALRANLRRRKAKPPAPEASSPKSTD